jgi:hypothetical protein
LQEIVSFHLLLLAVLHALGDDIHEEVNRFSAVYRESNEFGEFLKRLHENELECFPTWRIENVRGDLTEFVRGISETFRFQTKGDVGDH